MEPEIEQVDLEHWQENTDPLLVPFVEECEKSDFMFIYGKEEKGILKLTRDFVVIYEMDPNNWKAAIPKKKKHIISVVCKQCELDLKEKLEPLIITTPSYIFNTLGFITVKNEGIYKYIKRLLALHYKYHFPRIISHLNIQYNLLETFEITPEGFNTLNMRVLD